MNITFRGNAVTLTGRPLREGDPFPHVTLTDGAMQPVTNDDFSGICMFATVPSLDTGVCDQEIRRFHEKAAELPNVSIYAVSLDLPFAQARWCGAAGISAVSTLSDYRDRNFGHATGTFIEELCLLTRAVFLVDTAGRVTYAEYVPEVTDHPDYDRIFEELNQLTGGQQ